MTNKPLDLAAIHKLSLYNEARLKASTQAGCFDRCLSIFPISQIKHWIDDEPQRTALCPNCGFDTVLADDGSFELTHELLKAMNARYTAAGNPNC